VIARAGDQLVQGACWNSSCFR